MNFLLRAADVFLHLDVHLGAVISNYGSLTYGFLFLIVFCETGLVVTPFLPGDSLLFATGAFAALGVLDIKIAFILLAAAAILGDTANYWIGRRLGPKAFKEANGGLLRKEHLERTQRFFEAYGGKAIVLARFVPIVRTVAPFVAGVGSMHYRRFITYNIVGGILWVGLFVFGGYAFGNIPTVRDHFGLVVISIIILSTIPPVVEYWRYRRGADKSKGA